MEHYAEACAVDKLVQEKYLQILPVAKEFVLDL